MRRIMAMLLSAVLLIAGLLQTGIVQAGSPETIWLPDGREEALTVTDAVYKEGAIAGLAAAEAPGELIANGSYEILDGNGWASTWAPYVFSGTPVTTVDDAVYKDGSRSLKISASIDSRVSVTKTIPIASEQRGKTFKFKQWIKTENVSGSARNRIQYKNSQGVTVGDHVFTEMIKGTQDWKLTETFITIPANPDIVKFVFETFFETGTGTAWYDGTSMAPWIPLEAIAFGQEDYTVPVGETIAIDATLIPANASEQALVWTTSDSAVAAVEAGIVTGASSGAAVVTAASADGKIRASAIVFVGSASGGVTAEDAAVETDQREAASGTIQAYSETGRPLTFEIAASPAHGLLGMDNVGRWNYYPDESFYGSDRFIVIVKDDAGNYAVSRITVTVRPVNRPPAANDEVYPTVKNMAASGFVRATDPDGDSLSFEKASDSLHGQAVLQGDGKWSYTPDADYAGEDMFTVRVSDGKGGETFAAVRVYMAPLAEELVSELKAKNPDKKHSRLLATNEDFARIRSLLLTDNRIREWFETVKLSADLLLIQPVVPYRKPDGLRLDTEASSRIANLAFVFRVTGERKYLDRAWTELHHVSTEAYPDWSPGHFLDDATMTYGVSLGYDWLYDYLSGEQRDIVRHAIVEKGLKPALPLYAGMTYWTKNDNNWNFVCNAGMIAGALVVADEEEGIAGTILQGAFQSLQYGLRQYAPDGSSMEGPAYWSYGTDFLVYLLSSLETVYGHDFGFSAAEGISDTPNYPVYITGPQGTFNYSDGTAAFIPGKLLLWFAQRYQDPGYAWYHQFSNGKAADIRLYDILWYRPELYDGGEPALKDNYFARQQAVTARSSWTDPYALFAGFKGGVNGVSHSDLDIGSFVLDANGVRWATDPGSEDYNLPGYWDMTESGLRWTYYRKRAEGHNTVVINPSVKPEQNVTAVSEITKFEDNREQGAFAIADMTEAYKASVTSARRGIALTDHRRQFLVQDEIRAKLPSELYWFMHTTAQIDIAEDGQTAMLSSGDQRLQVQLLSPADARFSVMDAVPLPTSPNPPGQTPNTGVKKLAVHLQNVKDATISVRMIPLQPGQGVVTETPAVVPLDQWSVSDTLLAKLDRILVDGEPIAEFQPDRYMYTAEIPYGANFPAIEAIAGNPQHSVRMTEAASGLFRIDVEDTEHTADSAAYFVKILYKEERRGEPAVQAPIPGKPYQATKLPVSAVKASADDGNLPGNTVDGKLDTRWSASGEQWIQFDLGGKKSVREIAIAWYSGNQRSSLFDIEVSDNGYIWEWVYSGKSSGTTTDFETYALREASGRYVRIKGHGNTANAWNSIAEVAIHGESYKEPETSALVPEAAAYSLRAGETYPLSVKAVYSDGSVRDVTAETVYSSEDDKVAAVDESGMITGVAQGNTFIWMSYGGVERKVAVAVSAADENAEATGIMLDSNRYALTAGDTRNTTVQALYSDGSLRVVTVQATYTSSAPQTAMVDGNGIVTAKAAGTAVITAVYEGFEARAEVTVVWRESGSGNGSGTGNGSGSDNGSGSGSAAGNAASAGDLSDKVKAAALDDKAIVYMTADSANSQAGMTIKEIGGEQRDRLIAGRKTPLSGVYEIRLGQDGKSGKLEEPATVIVKADLSKMKSGQRAALFRYDASAAAWIEIGGTTIGNKLIAEVNEMGMFAVFAVDEQAAEGGALPGGGTASGNSFTDASGHWASGFIRQAAAAGFVDGYPDGTFRPDARITRAEFVAMLMRALKKEASGGELPFTDRDSIAGWAAAAVAEAVRSNIVNGYEDGSFRPNAPITREEITAILMRAMGISGEAGGLGDTDSAGETGGIGETGDPDSAGETGGIGETGDAVGAAADVAETDDTPFADDADIPDWAKGFIKAALAKGIIEGREGNVFAPQAETTRAEAIVMLLRWLESDGD